MSKEKPIPKTIKSRKLAVNLRNNATKEEKHLWYDFLSTFQLRFHRQYVIEQYIVDFFCPKAKLVIEIDGGQHYEPDAMEYDRKRTRVIEKYGFTVLRYNNLDINQRFRAVCEDIDNKVNERMRTLCRTEN